MKYQRYAKYKDSSIEWIEEIPEHWDITRARWLFREINERSTNGDETLLSVSEYYGVKPRKDVIDPGDFITNATSLEGYKKCQKNDLVMNIMLAWKGALGITDYDGIVSPSYNVYRPLKPKDSKYLHYLFRTKVYADIFRNNSTGIIDSRLRLYPDSFASVKVIRPPLEDQISICKFLDVQLRRVEGLTIGHEKMIRLLKEKRQAIITHAVTKGLDPNVPMKDSGIEWIGEIPEDWGLKRLKAVSKIQFSNVDKHIFDNEIPVLLVNYTDVYKNQFITNEMEFMEATANPNEIKKFQLEVGDVLVTKDSETPDDIAIPALVKSTFPNLLCGYHLAMLRPNRPSLDSNYLFYLYSDKKFRGKYESEANGITRFGLSQESFSDTFICLPSISGQKAISLFLEEQTSKIDYLISKQQQMIELLQEHKTSLITQAVTGKIDVRGLIQEVKEPAGQTP